MTLVYIESLVGVDLVKSMAVGRLTPVKCKFLALHTTGTKRPFIFGTLLECLRVILSDPFLMRRF